MNGGTLYATGKYGAISNSHGKARNINSSLTILYSESQNANTDDMSVGTADDTTREGDVKTIYIAKMGPRASLTVGAQQGTLQESLGSQTATFSVTGDTLADLNEDLAAEQKARMTYDNILRFADDPDVRDPIKFLRAREVVHYQRFGEGLRIATDRLDSKNFYAFNPSFDK